MSTLIREIELAFDENDDRLADIVHRDQCVMDALDAPHGSETCNNFGYGAFWSKTHVYSVGTYAVNGGAGAHTWCLRVHKIPEPPPDAPKLRSDAYDETQVEGSDQKLQFDILRTLEEIRDK